MMDHPTRFEDEIRSLLAAGKITADEAAQLLSDGGPASGPEPAPATDAPRRLSVKLFGGDVRVRGVAGLERPALVQGQGSLELRPTRDGWRLVPRGIAAADGLLGMLVRGLKGLQHQPIEIEVPAEFSQVEIDVVTGEVEVDDLDAPVTVRTQSGAVRLRRTGSFDVSTKVGNVRVRAAPGKGTHRIAVLSGDVELELLEGTDVTLDAAVLKGDVHARRLELARVDGLVGGRWEGRAGGGAGLLEVSVTSGDLDVRYEGGRAA